AAEASTLRARTRREPLHPRQPEVLDGLAVDLRQRAVPPARVVAGVGRPAAAERLVELRGRHAHAGLAGQADRQQQHRQNQQNLLHAHLRVARYAVTSCMSFSVRTASSSVWPASGSVISSRGWSPVRRMVRVVPSSSRIVTRKSSYRTSGPSTVSPRSEEHTSELQSREKLVCRLLLEKKKILDS